MVDVGKEISIPRTPLEILIFCLKHSAETDLGWGAKTADLTLNLQKEHFREFPKEILMPISGDTLYTIVRNIFDNCGDHIKGSDIAISVTSRREEGDKNVVIEVTDNGPGISEENLKSRQRINAEEISRHPLSGLGQAIRNAEALGGKILVGNETPDLPNLVRQAQSFQHLL